MALLENLFGKDEAGKYKPVVLVIFDGLGVAPPSEGMRTRANTGI